MSTDYKVQYSDIIKSKKVRVWGKGQLTIPVEIREKLKIKENSYLEVFQIGKAFIATPESLIIKELADSFQKEMLKDNLDLKKLLQDLREGSHEYETE